MKRSSRCLQTWPQRLGSHSLVREFRVRHKLVPQSICLHSDRNRAHLLKQTLESLDRQTVAPQRFQVAVADDGSTDGTIDMLRRMRAGSELI